MNQSPNQIALSNYGTPQIPFQLSPLTIQQKSDYEWGKQLAQDIESKVNGGTSSYFWVRNQRFKTNRNYANGRINMSRFQDYLEFNGKTNYININWQCIHIVNRIVSGLVGRWMNKNEKITVTATDPLSVRQKHEEFERLEFIIDNREKLEKLQQESGVQMIPQDDSIPADKDQLKLWKATGQKLPEEIGYEMGVNDVFAANGWYDTLKEKVLHDSSETGFVGTYTWMDNEGVIHVEWLKPENCFYSYSSYPDFRDTTWRGYMRSLKISEMRKKYGREFHPNDPHSLTEEQLFQLAQTAKEYQLYDNITWITEWNVTFLRPYDEWNVDILEFEYKTVDKEAYTKIKTKKNNSTILKKGAPKKLGDNEEIIEDSRINIYRGVYCRTNQIMLEWGLKKNMIRPQDPKEIGNAEFSYSFYMVQSYDMTCLGVPEKIQEPADQMIIARLKLQQLVAKMRPPGTAINWRSVQNVDYGLGDANKAIDFKKYFDQTGDFYYNDKDAEGNPIGVPFTEIPNAGFLPQLQALILLYDKHYQIMKDELGEDPNLITQAAQPRVAVQNIEASQQQAAFATDYYYLAYVRVLEDTARKVSCLLKDSVTYGATVYRNIVGEKDVDGRFYSTKIQMLPNDVEIARFEALLNQSLASNPDLNIFINQFELMRVAKEDVKLAEALYRQGQKKMLIWQRQVAAENTQQTAKVQIESAQAAEQAKQQTEQLKGDIDLQKTKMQEDSAVKTSLSVMFTSLMKEGSQIPANMQPIFNAWAENIMIPMVAQNEGQKAEIIEQMREAQMQSQQQPIQEQNQQPPLAA